MKDMTWYEYLFTQFRVFFVYLRLFFLPSGQTVDYDFPISQTILDQEAILGLIVLLALIGAAVFYRRRYPLASYGLFTFSILLAPTSSIIPIHDPISERRLYLPMIGLLLIVLEILLEGVRRLRISRTALDAALSALLVIAAALTYRRNIVWSGAIPLWEDAVAKSPGKARAHFWLGRSYFDANRCQDAETQYEAVAKLETPEPRLLIDWALADNCLNRSDEAIAKLERAAALEKTAHVYSQIAMMYAKTNRPEQAFQALDTAEKLDPRFETTYIYRGQMFEGVDNLPAAAQQFQRALAINPRNEQALAGMERLRRRWTGAMSGGGRPLRIGVNALYLIPGGVGGTEIYLRSLLPALARYRSPDRFFVFTNRETGPICVPAAEQLAGRSVDVRARNRPARILCEQIGCHWKPAGHRLDVLFNPGFTAPLACSCPHVTVFHDLQHKRQPENFRWFDLPFWRMLLYGVGASFANI